MAAETAVRWWMPCGDMGGGGGPDRKPRRTVRVPPPAAAYWSVIVYVTTCVSPAPFGCAEDSAEAV